MMTSTTKNIYLRYVIVNVKVRQCYLEIRKFLYLTVHLKWNTRGRHTVVKQQPEIIESPRQFVTPGLNFLRIPRENSSERLRWKDRTLSAGWKAPASYSSESWKLHPAGERGENGDGKTKRNRRRGRRRAEVRGKSGKSASRCRKIAFFALSSRFAFSLNSYFLDNFLPCIEISRY